MTKRPTCLLLAALLAASAPRFAAGGDALSVLGPAPGARATALATAGTADDADPANALLNPANAAGGDGVTMTSTYANWTGDADYFANVFVWGGNAGAVRMAGALGHRRLEFKVYEEALDFVPFNTQTSYMTATAAVRWSGERGALGAGVALGWDTSERADEDVLFDVGLRAEAPAIERARWRAGFALGWSALHGGGGVEPLASSFATGAGTEEYRYGTAIHLEFGENRDVVAVTLDADVVDTADVDGASSAAGIEVSVAGLLHARAGYGDGIIAGKSATTVGAGAGASVGMFSARVDYARVETRDDALSANVFGATLLLEF